jgi:hypothetical protein
VTYRLGRILSLLTLLLAGNAAANDTLAPLFDRISAAYGATPPPAMRETGSMTSFRKGNAPVLRLYRTPNHFRIAIGYASGVEVRTMIGEQAWLQDEPASVELRGAIALQKARIELPWSLLAGKAVRDLGNDTDANGKMVRLIELPIVASLKMIVDIDPDTGRILRSRGIQDTGNGMILEFSTTYSNFRTQHGRLHAQTEQYFIMGKLVGQFTIETVDYPATLPDDVFAPFTEQLPKI